MRRACDEAYAAQVRFREARNALGREALDALGPDGKAVVLVGKAHNIHDPGTNLNLARILRGMGIQTIPSDLLDLFHSPDVGEAWRNMTLAMGQRTLGRRRHHPAGRAAQRHLSGEFRLRQRFHVPAFLWQGNGRKAVPAA